MTGGPTAWPSTPARRAAVAGALLLAGAVTGFAAVVASGRTWGLLLAVVATVLSLAALPPRAWTRSPYALGWVLPVGLAILGRPEGDYAIGDNARGYGFFALTMAVVVTGVVALAGEGRGRPPADDRPT